MKKFMLCLNGILAGLSFCVLLACLVTAHFGSAWICVPIVFYFLFNVEAIEE